VGGSSRSSNTSGSSGLEGGSRSWRSEWPWTTATDRSWCGGGGWPFTSCDSLGKGSSASRSSSYILGTAPKLVEDRRCRRRQGVEAARCGSSWARPAARLIYHCIQPPNGPSMPVSIAPRHSHNTRTVQGSHRFAPSRSSIIISDIIVVACLGRGGGLVVGRKPRIFVFWSAISSHHNRRYWINPVYRAGRDDRARAGPGS